MSTERIAEFIVETRHDQIPEEALGVAKRCFLDTLACGLAGVEQHESRIIAQRVRDFGGHPEAGIIGNDFKAPVPLAALANGTIAYSIHYDGFSLKFLLHPAVSLVPAILALAESKRISGSEILDSYVIAFEVGANLGDIMGIPFLQKKWHPTKALGTIGTTTAAARILRLDVEKTRMALGIAASSAGGLLQNDGTMTMPLHAGSAAQNGILSAMLAEDGFTANDSIIEGGGGFCEMFSGVVYDSKRVEKALGRIWYIVSPGFQFKLHPCCFGPAGCQDAILELKRKYDISPKDVKEVECRLSRQNVEAGAFIHSPRVAREARLSLEYQMAIAIIDGDLSLKQFTDDEKVKSPLTKELMSKVRTVCPPNIGMGMDFSQEVVVRLKNGKEYSQRVGNPKGTAENPVSDDELITKFRNCVSLTLSPEGVEEALDLIWHLDELKDITRLMELVTFKK